MNYGKIREGGILELVNLLIQTSIFMEYQPINQPEQPAVESSSQPPVQTAPLQAQTKIPPARTKTKLLIIIAGIVLVAALAIIFLGEKVNRALEYYKPAALGLLPGISSEPEISAREILQKSSDAFWNIKTFSFSVTSTGKMKSTQVGSGLPSEMNIIFGTDGAIDLTTIEKPLFKAALNVKGDAKSATSSGSLLLGTDLLYDQKNAYFRLKDFSVSYTSSDPEAMGVQMFVGMANGFVESLKGKWIMLSKPKVSKTGDAKPLTAEDIALVREYLSGLSYIASAEIVGEETVDGIPAYHVKAAVQHGPELKTLIRKIALKRSTVPPKDMAAFDKEIDEFVKNLGQKVDMDLWIGKSDYMVYKMVTTPVTVHNEKSGMVAITSQEATFGNFNQPVSIVAPQGSEPLEKVMQGAFGGMLKSR